MEAKLREVKDNFCKLAVVTGQTKSGKTVLTKNIFPDSESIWISGGSVSNENVFWDSILVRLGLFQSKSTESKLGISGDIVGKGTAEAGILIAKGKAEVGASVGAKREATQAEARSVPSQLVVTNHLQRNKVPLVIDDFHYIPRDLQGKIVRALKPLSFEGLPVVIIAITHRRYDALKVEREMTGRISPIEIPTWSEDELQYIPKTGFNLLNCGIPHEMSSMLSSESIGSPHLMQDFCRGLCKFLNITYRPQLEMLLINETQIKSVFKEVANTIGRPIFEKLALGPRRRTDRLQRKLKDDRIVDIYALVLHALAHLRPALISIEYEQLRTAVKDVVGTGTQIPQLHEISRVLKQMATIASSDASSTPVIDFEEGEKKLHITDPFFSFYLRWGELDLS